MSMHILATASSRSPIYIWDIYAPNKPISKLQILGRKVISLKIHYPVCYLYALTSNSVFFFNLFFLVPLNFSTR